MTRADATETGSLATLAGEVLHLGPDAISVVDRDGTIIEVAGAVEAVLGRLLARDELTTDQQEPVDRLGAEHTSVERTGLGLVVRQGSGRDDGREDRGRERGGNRQHVLGHVPARRGRRAASSRGQRFPLTACISGWAMLHCEQVVIPNVSLDERIRQEAYRPTFVASLVMTPIVIGEPVRAIGAYWSWTHEASDEERALLFRLAEVTANAMRAVGFGS